VKDGDYVPVGVHSKFSHKCPHKRRWAELSEKVVWLVDNNRGMGPRAEDLQKLQEQEAAFL
jgi:hypothetical protein